MKLCLPPVSLHLKKVTGFPKLTNEVNSYTINNLTIAMGAIKKNFRVI
jgi:hypothetical protein